MKYEVVVTPIARGGSTDPVARGRRVVVEARTPEHARRWAQAIAGPLMAVFVVPEPVRELA